MKQHLQTIAAVLFILIAYGIAGTLDYESKLEFEQMRQSSSNTTAV